MCETIELRKRTPSEQEAYVQGLAAGIRMGTPKQMVLVVQMQMCLKASDAVKLREDIEAQMRTGLVVLDPTVKFCGTVPADSDVEVLVKAVKEAMR